MGKAVKYIFCTICFFSLIFARYALESKGEKFRKLGIKAFNTEKFSDSILYFERFVKLEPNSSSAHYYLGKALLYRTDLKPASDQRGRERIYKNYKRAVREIHRSLKIANMLDIVRTEIKPAMIPYAEHHFHLATAYWYSGLWEQALTHFRYSTFLDGGYL